MKHLNDLLQKKLEEMCLTGHLFRSSVTGEQLWEAYLKGFGQDPVFRDPSSSVHNCNLCNNFIRRYGNIIAFDQDYNLISLWDVEGVDEEYIGAVKAMSDLVKTGKIQDIFIETFDWLNTSNFEKTNRNMHWYRLGLASNVKKYTLEEARMYPLSGIKEGDIKTFNHLSVVLPDEFVDKTGRSREALMGDARSRVQVFRRALEEIPLDTIELIRDLEAQGSLLNGESYRHIILKAIKAKEEYNKLPDQKKKDAYVWVEAENLGVAATFRNMAIGTLMVDLAEGRDINEAVESFNKMVDPVNYKKCTAPITKRQIEEAEKFVEENGYSDSFERRCATIEDINVSEILHSNMEAKDIKSKVSIFSGIKSTAPTRHKKSEFDKVEEVGIEKFMVDILPTCSSVEVYLTAKHKSNFVNLLTSENKDSKGMFKWKNNFSWTYAGNLTGKSLIAQKVKSMGGTVDAPLRCSIIWNETGDAMHTDFDNHCVENIKGRRDEIFYGQHRERRGSWGDNNPSLGGGLLDIDITNPQSQCNGGAAVENIYYKTYKDGSYTFELHNYNSGDNQGGRAEIVFEGNTYQYVIPHRVSGGVANKIVLATLHIKNGELERIEQSKYFVGEGEENSTNIYGLDTCEFHKVNLLCLSPNYWEGQGVGNKHYFFMLEGAKNPETIRSIHNEFLNDELTSHRKVMEVLGSTLKVDSTDGQLCGLGFNSTVRDEVILRLGGSHKRVIKVKI